MNKTISTNRRKITTKQHSVTLKSGLPSRGHEVYLHPRSRAGLPELFARAGPWQSDYTCRRANRRLPPSSPCPWVSNVPSQGISGNHPCCCLPHDARETAKSLTGRVTRHATRPGQGQFDWPTFCNCHFLSFNFQSRRSFVVKKHEGSFYLKAAQHAVIVCTSWTRSRYESMPLRPYHIPLGAMIPRYCDRRVLSVVGACLSCDKTGRGSS